MKVVLWFRDLAGKFIEDEWLSRFVQPKSLLPELQDTHQAPGEGEWFFSITLFIRMTLISNYFLHFQGLIMQHLLVRKLTRRELEDKYLRLIDENFDLKRDNHQQKVINFCSVQCMRQFYWITPFEDLRVKWKILNINFPFYIIWLMKEKIKILTTKLLRMSKENYKYKSKEFLYPMEEMLDSNDLEWVFNCKIRLKIN